MGALHILGGTAAQGLIQRLSGSFQDSTGNVIEGDFGAVGFMRDKLLTGAPCDVLILTQSLIEELTVAGRVMPGTARALGLVRAGLAVSCDELSPAVDTAEAFKDALLAARGIHIPDPVKTVVGEHFMGVLNRIGLARDLAPMMHVHENGQVAVEAMVMAEEPGHLACAQISEILVTPGAQLAGPLPKSYELNILYTAAVAARTQQPQAARYLIDLLAAPSAAELRRAGGFE